MFLLNILLALSWMALTGQFSPTNLIEGFVLGYLMLWLVQHSTGQSRYFSKMRQVLGFALFFAWELILANLRVAYSVLTPQIKLRPGIVAIPLDVQTDTEITLLVNLITLTPGTLSLDVSADRRVLYVHTIHVDDVDDFRCQIKQGFERRIQELLG
jgi:multicomponent Na+:H+ antiporter subunit E